jgi:hypothetical protein
MAQTVRAIFDGEVLRPQQPVNLQANTTYVVTIESEAPMGAELDDDSEEYPLTLIGRFATDLGITDFAARHDFYAHGRVPDEDGEA